MGETDHDSIVWDIVAVYEPGKLWDQKPPEPAYSGGAVVEVIDEARTAIRQQLDKTANTAPKRAAVNQFTLTQPKEMPRRSIAAFSIQLEVLLLISET